MYRSALRAAGYAVFAGEDGIDALQSVEQTLPAAVVLDLGLLRLDGRDVHREIASKGYNPRIPIIVVTGQTENIDEREYACVLRKPVDPDDLVDAVARCLRQQRAERSPLAQT